MIAPDEYAPDAGEHDAGVLQIGRHQHCTQSVGACHRHLRNCCGQAYGSEQQKIDAGERMKNMKLTGTQIAVASPLSRPAMTPLTEK